MSPSKHAAKQELREWERAFRKIHNRKPSKNDVKSAAKRIQDLYQMCFPSKTLHQSSVKRNILEENPVENSSPVLQLRKPLSASRAFPLFKKRKPLQDAELSVPLSKRPRLDSSVCQPSAEESESSMAALRRSPRKKAAGMMSPLKENKQLLVPESPLSNAICGVQPKLRRSPRKRLVPSFYEESPEKCMFVRQNSQGHVRRNVCTLLDRVAEQSNQVDTQNDTSEQFENNQDAVENEEPPAAVHPPEKPKRKRAAAPKGNFVRLNMRHNRYSRGHKKLNPAALKRLLYKKKFCRKF